jgi:hypothetical protein
MHAWRGVAKVDLEVAPSICVFIVELSELNKFKLRIPINQSF